jgi:hypothetical protein
MSSLTAIQSGTWADWANATATTLAFTVALVLFFIGLRDRRQANDDRERDQARRVWLWTTAPENLEPGAESTHWRLVNLSDDPITRCRIDVGSMDPGRVARSEPAVRVLRPNDRIDGSLPRSDGVPVGALGPPAQVIFADSAGVQWRRDSDGTLELWERPAHQPRRPPRR